MHYSAADKIHLVMDNLSNRSRKAKVGLIMSSEGSWSSFLLLRASGRPAHWQYLPARFICDADDHMMHGIV